MSRIPKGEDPDFLARAKLPHDPHSFQELFREAFHLEHDCLQDGDIAEVVGLSKGRISQILGKPALLKPETLASLLGHLRGQEAKRMILLAWNAECFGIELSRRSSASLPGKKFTSRTIKRIDRLIREARLVQAAELVSVGVEVVRENTLRQEVLGRAYWLYQSLNRPGSALGIASEIFESACLLGDTQQMIQGKLYSLRIQVALQNPPLEKITADIHWLNDALEQIRPNAEGSNGLPPKHQIIRTIIAAELSLLERGLIQPDMEKLARSESLLREELAIATKYQTRFSILLQLARIHLVRGELFEAEETLLKAFRSGDVKNLQALETCGLVEARIMIKSGNIAKAIAHLNVLSAKCFETENYYHGWLIETELAMAYLAPKGGS